MKIKSIFLFLILFTSSLFSQEYRITKLIDTNTFELNNKQKVSLYGLHIPSINDTNSFYASVAKEIYNWEKNRLLNKVFLFEFVETDGNIKIAKIFRTYAIGKENISNWFLSYGYGFLKKDNSDYDVLSYYEKEAIDDQKGLWGHKMQNKDELLAIDQIELEGIKYERPYGPVFLFLSITSFVLAWDNFSTASDIQETINALKFISNEVDLSELESSKKRKTIVGITCLVAGVVTAIFSFKSVEVRTNLHSISFSYKF